jgi:hypothetical protein
MILVPLTQADLRGEAFLTTRALFVGRDRGGLIEAPALAGRFAGVLPDPG